MKVVISINRKYEEMIVTLQSPSNTDLDIFSKSLNDYSSKINDSVEFQTIHISTQWTFFFYTINQLERISQELAQCINFNFGKDVVEIKGL